MHKRIYVTKAAPAPVGPYSQAVEARGLVYASGQIALDAQTGQMVTGSIEDQTKKVMANVGAVLEAAGLDYRHIVKTTIFLTDLNAFARVNEVYASYFNEDPPARSCVEVSALPKGAQVEIEVIAVRAD